MNRSLRSVSTSALVAGAILAAGASIASAHGPDPVLGGGWWDQNERLEFRWRAGSEPPTDIRNAIKAAAEDVNQTKASKAASFVYAAGGDNPVGYGPGATCGVNGIGCFTRTAGVGFTMWLREQGHVFDWGKLKWCQLYDAPPNGCYDAETVALDEFGHIEGLGHHDNYANDSDYGDAVVQTVSRTKPRAHYDMHVLGVCDIATLQREYDVASSATKYSTCLDVDTTLTLSADPRGVAAGETSRFTAVLKVADRASYDRMVNNPVSGRSVKLQRRAVGTTTWSAVTTMAPGTSAGTYAASVRMQTSGEFRAVFSTPSNEGLNGDTSGTVTVTVARAVLAGATGAR